MQKVSDDYDSVRIMDVNITITAESSRKENGAIARPQLHGHHQQHVGANRRRRHGDAGEKPQCCIDHTWLL